jgi:hypothetical protein
MRRVFPSLVGVTTTSGQIDLDTLVIPSELRLSTPVGVRLSMEKIYSLRLRLYAGSPVRFEEYGRLNCVECKIGGQKGLIKLIHCQWTSGWRVFLSLRLDQIMTH